MKNMDICWIRSRIMRTPFTVLTLGLSLFSLAACEMYAESHVNDRRMQVREERLVDEVPTARLNQDYVGRIAQDYSQNGRGAVDLTVTYDPTSKTNTAMHAGDEAARLARTFRKEGMTDINTSVLPVRDQGAESMTIIAYTSYQAAAPKNCGVMPGYKDTVLEVDPSYKIGCTVESTFAQQIADPSDLLGDAELSTYRDGQATAFSVNGYRTGAQNEPLDGVTASDD
jgi:type IV pilus biogenesis protein CpaD/CtpE